MTTEEKLLAPPRTMAQFQGMVDAIYREKDERDYTDEDLLLHVGEESVKLAEGARKDKPAEIISAVPGFLIWLWSFCNRMGIALDDAVWDKYHGCCPYCGKERACQCIGHEEKPETWHRNEYAARPETLDGWQSMFKRIYGGVDQVAGLTKLVLHTLEEVGETSRAFRLSKLNGERELWNELADVFAWIAAVCNHHQVNVNIAEITYAKYPGVCNVCRQPNCTCPLV